MSKSCRLKPDRLRSNDISSRALSSGISSLGSQSVSSWDRLSISRYARSCAAVKLSANMNRRLGPAELKSGEAADMSDYDHAFGVNHDGLSPSEFPKRSRNFVDRALRDLTSVAFVWLDLV